MIMGFKMPQKLKEFFKLDKSRLIIFILILLLFPTTISYSTGPCRLFHSPGLAEYICHITKPAFILIPLALIDSLFYGYVPISSVINTFVLDLLISFILSYPLNVIYKRVERR